MDKTSRVIEITVLSGEELRIGRKQRVKKNAFVIVKAGGDAGRTTMDRDGGSYPTWNEKVVMNLPMHVRHVTVEVHCKTHIGNKIVGTANIPTSDFVGGYVPEGYLHLLSYRLRDSYGERNGIINLSIRVKTPGKAAQTPGKVAQTPGKAVYGTSSAVTPGPRPWVGVPVGDSKVSNGIVTGVPIGYLS